MVTNLADVAERLAAKQEEEKEESQWRRGYLMARARQERLTVAA
jgi:hypothetical protein